MQRWACIHPDRHESIRSFREWAKTLPLEERKRIDGFKFFREKDVWRWECVIKGIYGVLLAEHRNRMPQPSQTVRLRRSFSAPPPPPIEPLLSGVASAVEAFRDEIVRRSDGLNQVYFAPLSEPPTGTGLGLLNPDQIVDPMDDSVPTNRTQPRVNPDGSWVWTGPIHPLEDADGLPF